MNLPAEITSVNGITYSLYEGIDSDGHTSDICFIMLDKYDAAPQLVHWIYGANEDIAADIARIITEYEQRNAILVRSLQELK